MRLTAVQSQVLLGRIPATIINRSNKGGALKDVRTVLKQEGFL